MRSVARIIAIVGFATMTFAAQSSLKQKLAQNNLAQVQENGTPSPPPGGVTFTDCETCTAYVESADVEEFDLGTINCIAPDAVCDDVNAVNAVVTTESFNAEILQSVSLTEIPAQTIHQHEESVCCSTEAERHGAVARACKVRNFDISGNICVQESVEFHESEFAREQAIGYAQSNSCSQEYAESQDSVGVNCSVITNNGLDLTCTTGEIDTGATL